VWRWDNTEPFGNSQPDEDPSALGAFNFNLRFPGQYFDAESGLSYNYYRDYDPGLGRYIESDPIGLRSGLNTYGYVGGSSLTSIDPMGLQAIIVCVPPGVCFPMPLPPPMPGGSGSSAGGGSNVFPLPGRGSSSEDKKVCPPEPDDYCSKEQRRIESNRKYCTALQSITAAGYRACAVGFNEDATQHNLFCPKNRVEKLPLPTPTPVP
jgi:RHS repeat-associated protein